MKKTQKDIVIKQLLSTGYISRNWCLERFISRLGAIICDLKEEGWDFKTKTIEGNYWYKAIKSPYKKVTYTDKVDGTVRTSYTT